MRLPHKFEPPARRRLLRQWAIVFVIVFSLLILGAVWGRLHVLPNFRPPLRAGEELGIDLKSHQEPINWKMLRTQNVRFAYFEVTNGTKLVNANVGRQWNNAQSAGVTSGAMSQFSLCATGQAQAEAFDAAAPTANRSRLDPAVVLQLTDNCAARPTRDELRLQLLRFTQIVENHFQRPLVYYVAPDFVGPYPLRFLEHVKVWLTSYPHRPIWSRWVMWRVDPSAEFVGISGPVNLDVARIAKISATITSK